MAHWHKVRQGESVPSIAEGYGFGTWEAIYEHTKNELFRQKHPDPYVLLPGAQLYIPDKEHKYVSCATEQVHRFQLTRQFTWVRLVLEDEAGTIFGDKKYVLTVGDERFEGRTGEDGLLEQKVPAMAREGELEVWLDDADADPTFTWTLEIGHLDPVEAATGVQARLNNLGFDAGAEDGDLGPRTQEALKAFQRKAGLEPTGELDDTTRGKLVELHGS